MASKIDSSGGRVSLRQAKAARVTAGWLTRSFAPAGLRATARWQGRVEQLEKPSSSRRWRFGGLYVHVCKLETLRAAYEKAKQNDGAPGIDGVTFEAIEEAEVERFLEQVRDELVARTYRPQRNRRVEIPKDGGKVRVLGIPNVVSHWRDEPAGLELSAAPSVAVTLPPRPSCRVRG